MLESTKIYNFFIEKKKYDLLFILGLFLFAIVTHFIPLPIISVFTGAALIYLLLLDFEAFVRHEKSKLEVEESKEVEFSWGYYKVTPTKETAKDLIQYVEKEGLPIFKKYLSANYSKILVFIFIFGDLIVALKNLPLKEAGAYVALSIFCKFIFFFILYFKREFSKIPLNKDETHEYLVDFFYKNLNGLLSLGVVSFILLFFISKFIIDIFFGNSFLEFHTSLPYIFISNVAMLLCYLTYLVSSTLDYSLTKSVIKFYIPFFTILFVFIANIYIDTVAYFIVGSAGIFFVFLYNTVIKKPSYTLDTYKSLF